MNQPAFPDIGVISLQYHRWTPLFMTQHHVMSRLARFFPIVWVDRGMPWREALTSGSPSLANPPLPADFDLDPAPRWLPRFHRPRWLADASFDARIRRARARLLARGCRRIVLYLWRPEFARALTAIPHDLSCYHIDDDYTFSTVEVPIPKDELDLIRGVDQVFIHSPGLMQRMGGINPATTFMPQGADYGAFASPAAAPADISQIPRPIVGYMGNLKRQLDWELLRELAERHPEWSFLFVGPTSAQPEPMAGVAMLKRFPNCHFVGSKRVQELPGYVQQFDVCLMPYRVDSYTNSIYPLKLHDYLATGRPVVSSRIRTALDFGEVVALPNQMSEWEGAIAAALRPEANTEAARQARRLVAQGHDWSVLIDRLATTIETRLRNGGRGPGGARPGEAAET